MYTPTHFLEGFVLGGILFRRYEYPTRLKLQMACGIGASAPDIPLFVKMIFNKAQGKELLTGWSPLSELVSNGLHSALIWSAIFAVAFCCFAWWRPLIKLVFTAAVAIGFISHSLVDAATHGNGSGIHAKLYLWPLTVRLDRVIGVWDYMPKSGYWPRWQEWVIFTGLLFAGWWQVSRVRPRDRAFVYSNKPRRIFLFPRLRKANV